VSSGIVEVYVCSYVPVEQKFPRHHITGYSLCRLERELSFEELRGILQSSQLEQLLKNGEAIITDQELITKLTHMERKEYTYLRIVLKK